MELALPRFVFTGLAVSYHAREMNDEEPITSALVRNASTCRLRDAPRTFPLCDANHCPNAPSDRRPDVLQHAIASPADSRSVSSPCNADNCSLAHRSTLAAGELWPDGDSLRRQCEHVERQGHLWLSGVV